MSATHVRPPQRPIFRTEFKIRNYMKNNSVVFRFAAHPVLHPRTSDNHWRNKMDDMLRAWVNSRDVAFQTPMSRRHAVMLCNIRRLERELRAVYHSMLSRKLYIEA